MLTKDTSLFKRYQYFWVISLFRNIFSSLLPDAIFRCIDWYPGCLQSTRPYRRTCLLLWRYQKPFQQWYFLISIVFLLISLHVSRWTGVDFKVCTLFSFFSFFIGIKITFYLSYFIYSKITALVRWTRDVFKDEQASCRYYW